METRLDWNNLSAEAGSKLGQIEAVKLSIYKNLSHLTFLYHSLKLRSFYDEKWQNYSRFRQTQEINDSCSDSVKDEFQLQLVVFCCGCWARHSQQTHTRGSTNVSLWLNFLMQPVLRSPASWPQARDTDHSCYSLRVSATTTPLVYYQWNDPSFCLFLCCL